jgi:hypothetical protein
MMHPREPLYIYIYNKRMWIKVLLYQKFEKISKGIAKFGREKKTLIDRRIIVISLSTRLCIKLLYPNWGFWFPVSPKLGTK